MKELREQCERMLSITPDSFVFLYDVAGVGVIPALSIASSTRVVNEFGVRDLGSFFEAHLTSLVGDRLFEAALRDELERLRIEYSAPTALLLKATVTPAEIS
jgi:hypothetical protein